MIGKGTTTIQTQKVTRNRDTIQHKKQNKHKKYKGKANRQDLTLTKQIPQTYKKHKPKHKNETQLLLGKVTREPRNNTTQKVNRNLKTTRKQ